MIVSVMRNNIVVFRVGRPTLTFVNTIIRDNPAAMTAFEACRQAACALPAAAVTPQWPVRRRDDRDVHPAGPAVGAAADAGAVPPATPARWRRTRMRR